MEPNLTSLNMQLRYCRSFSHSPGWYQKKTWPDETLYLLRSGSITLHIQGQTFCAGAGDGIFLSAGDYGQMESAGGCSFLLVCFRLEAGNDHHLLSRLNCGGVYSGVLAQAAAQLLTYFPEGGDPLHFSARQYGGVLLFLAELMACAGKHQPIHRQPEDYSDWKLKRLLETMEAAAPEMIPIRELAQQMQMSEKYFIRLFHEQVGCTPGQYMNRLRMLHATQLLSDAELPLSEVAARLHYADVYAFSKAFRKYFGEAPGSFRGHSV